MINEYDAIASIVSFVHAGFEIRGFTMSKSFHLRLTHKIMAIGAVGLVGLLAFGAIYQIGSWSADASRAVASDARSISDLNRQLLTDMLEARRASHN